MSERSKRTIWVCVCAFVATALLLAAVPAVQAHAATKKPAQVKGVKVTNVGASSAKVVWAKSSTKTCKGYQVKVYKSGKTFGTYMVSGRSSTSKIATGLKAGGTYTTKVRAYTTKKSKKIYGKWSSTKKFTTKKSSSNTAKPATPAKPSKGDATDMSSGVVGTKYVDYHGCVFTINKVEVRDTDLSYDAGKKMLVVYYTFENTTDSDQYSSFIDLDAFQHDRKLSSSSYVSGLGLDPAYVISGGSTNGYRVFYLDDDSDVLLRAYDGFDTQEVRRTVKIK